MSAPSWTLGRYVPVDSLVHRLDARAKLLVMLLLTTASVLSAHWFTQGIVAAWLVAGFLAARLPVSFWMAALRRTLWLMIFVVAANATWYLVVRNAGWASGIGAVQDPSMLAMLLVRLVDLVLLGVLFTGTTIPLDAAEGLQRLAAPLQRLRVPVRAFVFLLVLALSFVPIFMDEARRLAAAHRIQRGEARWTPWQRLRAVVPLLVPLFAGVVRRSDQLEVALDSRCFRPDAPRTSLRPGRFGFAEGVVLALGAAAAATAWM